MNHLSRHTAFIIFALPRWDGQYASTSFSLSKEIAKSYRVFYIDNPFTIKDFLWEYYKPSIQSRLRPLLSGKNMYRRLELPNSHLTVVTPPLVAPINWIRHPHFYDAFSAINQRRVAGVLSKIVQDHQLTEYIFINSFNPFYFRSFPAEFLPKLSIYHTVDDISESKYVSRHGARLEKEAAQRADFVLTTSLRLKKLKEQENKYVHYLPNAADTAIFQTAFTQKLPSPKDVAWQGQDVIIFTGHLDQRIDVALLERTAQHYPEKMLLLVGPHSLSRVDHQRLSSHQNILFTGKKKLHELPAYLQLAQCAIIPFKCNNLTESIYPLKINEYLAAGLPVVSTAFSEDIRAFQDVAYLAVSTEQFLKNIQVAIQSNHDMLRAKRLAVAKNNTWENRVQQLYQHIDQHLIRKSYEVQKV